MTAAVLRSSAIKAARKASLESDRLSNFQSARLIKDPSANHFKFYCVTIDDRLCFNQSSSSTLESTIVLNAIFILHQNFTHFERLRCMSIDTDLKRDILTQISKKQPPDTASPLPRSSKFGKIEQKIEYQPKKRKSRKGYKMPCVYPNL